MVSDREEAKRKDAESAEAKEYAGEIRKRAGLIQEENMHLEQEIERIKGEIAKIGDSLLTDVLQRGWQAVREPEFFGDAGKAYYASRYQSVYEAMDSLERACLDEVRDHGGDERGG